MNVQWMIGMVVGAGTMGACADGGGAPLEVTRAQLAEQIGSGPLRIEVELRADGTVREVQIEDELGHEEQLEGRITGIDVTTQRIEVEHLGSVDYAGASRFRDGDDISAQSWLASAQAAMAAGRAVWIDARGAFAADGFYANELRFDDADIKVEADVAAGDYDPANGVLRIGALTFALGDARIGDDRGNDNNDDVFDDNGSDDDDSDDDNGTDDSDDDNGTDDSDDDNGHNGTDDSSDDNGSDDSTDDNGGDRSTDDNGGDDSTDDNGGDDSTDDNGGDDSTDDNGGDDSTDDNGGDDSTDDNGGDDSTDDNGGDDSTDDNGSDDDDDDHGGDDDDHDHD